TPTTLGLRKGICFVNLCDVVITGDTLAMHLGIALKKYVIAWFGLTCPQEIDLYGRGIKIIRDLPCAPCWKQECDRPHGPICVTEFDLDEIIQAVKNSYDKKDVYFTINKSGTFN
ncbi:MAG: glycosyltransferase family 9 protein, partial [bacterium]